jgi:hypothetical protein
MSKMDDRQKGFEGKFAHDAEIEFKATARRNKLLGLWAAEKLGKTGDEASAYAKDVVIADLEAAGDNDVIGKLLNDFGRAHLTVTVKEIEAEILRLTPVARKQIMEGK